MAPWKFSSYRDIRKRRSSTLGHTKQTTRRNRNGMLPCYTSIQSRRPCWQSGRQSYRSIENLEQKKRRKVGRPACPKGHAKHGTLRVRVTPDELRGIQAQARTAKQTVSEWIRSTLAEALP